MPDINAFGRGKQLTSLYIYLFIFLFIYLFIYSIYYLAKLSFITINCTSFLSVTKNQNRPGCHAIKNKNRNHSIN